MCDDPLLLQTRRHFFHNCAVGVGSLALTTLLNDNRLPAAETPVISPLMPRPTHFKARATSIIYLFMAGGPSQLELFDYKPKLLELDGLPIPDSYMQGKRFAFMDTFAKEVPKLLAAKRQFARHGQCGAWVSECLPHLAQVVDDIAIIRTVATDVFNHAPAKIFLNTGSPQFGRPSMGSW